MKLAIEEALFGKKSGEPPFGGIIIDAKGNIIARAHDTVIKNHDLTRHSELDLIRKACHKRGRDLTGYIVICTCEPCPLCFTAIWLAKVSTVIFGSYIPDVLKITNNKQRELNFSAKNMNAKSGKQIRLIGGILRKECAKLFKDYKYKNNN